MAKAKRAQGVSVSGCYDSICPECPGGLTGFAIFKLMVPDGYEGMIKDVGTGKFYAKDQTWKADFDSNGCFKTCPIPANTNLSLVDDCGNPLTHYELALFVDGMHTATESFVLDAVNNIFPPPPNCVDIGDLTWTSIPSTASPYHCALVQQCESPWEGISGPGVHIELDGNASACGGNNGHAPTVSAHISNDVKNCLKFGADQGLYVECLEFDCGDFDRVSINCLGDVAAENAMVNDMLCWNGEDWIAKAKTTVCVNQSPTVQLKVDEAGGQFCITANAKVSDDSKNLLTFGYDGGLFVGCPIFNSSDCLTVITSGSGQVNDPLRVFSEIKINPSPDNVISCTPDGLYASVDDCTTTSFTLQQEGCLDVTLSNPLVWRASHKGEVSFTIAGLALGGSTASGDTHFQIVNESGDPVYTGFIPASTSCMQMNACFDVNPCEGFAIKIIGPIPELAATGLTVQGEYTRCEVATSCSNCSGCSKCSGSNK